MKNLTTGVALVTGGGVRIGKAIALALAENGFAVAIQYKRSKDEAAATAAAVASSGGVAHCFEAELADQSEVEALIPTVKGAMGELTCLINNASHFADDRLLDLTSAAWDRHIAVNLKAPIFLAQAFAAELSGTESGNIVNITDQRILHPNPLFFSYTVSKSALSAATKTMAQALAPRIRVNAIAPGPALRNIYQSKEDFEHEARATLLAQGTTPEEVAEAVLFILRSPALTGQTIALDGGQHLLWQTPDIHVK